jgi:eukaryotic-like serine/threonine-protein kinase
MALNPGTRLGPYEILDAIGAGGMGEVYRARDPRLSRDVAIKIMAADLAKNVEWLRRFEQEARATAALSHPNVLAVYDVGESNGLAYLVTELLEGETLRERLGQGSMPVRKAVETVQQILAGLGAAHARGIVHRDLKPENIFLTRQGQAKILDFGLAKVNKLPNHASENSQPTLVSQPGLVVGTVSYMAPEQARGLPADHRADIFAIGVILYEMLSGQRAFHRNSMADTVSAILKEEPPSLSQRGIAAPPGLVRILNRCLEKDAADRFQSARDVGFALDSISGRDEAAPLREKQTEKSVAVLPFTNMGGDAEQEYFSDGLAEELINALAGLQGLRVASRTSAFRFRGRDLDIREIGRQLNVEAVLEGSVRRAGKRLRVTVQLINIADGYNLWSQRYDRELEDVFAIQDEITESIVKTLKPTLLGGQQPAARRHTENVEGFELYLKGRHLWQQRTQSSLRASIEYFEKAILVDPNYALAHAGIADSLGILRVYGYISEKDSRGQAEAAANRAMELDPGLAEAHFASALFLLYFSDNWPSAEAPLKEAVRLSPRNAMFHTYLGFFLAARHRIEEAEPLLSKGVELDPLSPLVHGLYGCSMYMVRRYHDAIRHGERSVGIDSTFHVGMVAIGVAKCCLGQYDQAIEVLERLVSHSDRNAWWVGVLGLAYALSGRKDDALRLRRELLYRRQREYISPYAYILIDIGLDDAEGIYLGLKTCIDERITGFALEIVLGPYLDPLASEPRFAELLRRLQIVLQRPA